MWRAPTPQNLPEPRPAPPPLRDRAAAHDSVAAHRVAHTLHGSVASVGAASMVHACAEIIRAVRLGAFEGCDQLLHDLQDDFESIRRAAEAHRV